jgi:hypothetical protein
MTHDLSDDTKSMNSTKIEEIKFLSSSTQFILSDTKLFLSGKILVVRHKSHVSCKYTFRPIYKRRHETRCHKVDFLVRYSTIS